MQDRLACYARRIREVNPTIDIATIESTGDGQNNDVVMVNEELVFRFPRYAAGIGQLKREVTLLRAIRDVVPLRVPDPIYTRLSPPVVGQAFSGYRHLPGRSLRHAPLALRHDVRAVRGIAAQLAAFLEHLHRVPLETALPDEGGRPPILARWEQLYERIRQRLFPHLRPEARARVVSHFEAFLRDPRHHATAPALVHGDFGAGNILYDATTQTITGIIDFGAAGPDDPAVDLAAASTIAPGLLAAFPRAYPASRGMLDWVAFYRGTFPLQEALFGIEHDDQAALWAGLAPYA